MSKKAIADRLFSAMIDGLKDKSIYREKELTIKDLEILVSQYKEGIHPVTYNQSILRMLSDVKDRDYIILNNDKFKEIVNIEVRKTNRNNQIWKDYLSEKIFINSKYL